MPELPEVEIAARQLRAWTSGRRISALNLVDPRLCPDALPELAGALVREVRRQGKYLILATEAADLVLHFRMTGKVVPDRQSPFTRMRLTLDDGLRLAFEDARRLGELRALPPGGASALPALRRMGPEPWPDRKSAAWWAERLRGARGPLKPTLMDQGRLGGLGNIAASEALWRAGLDPLRPGGGLGGEELERLADAVHSFLHDTVDAEGEGEVLYVNLDGAENPFSVYGRENEPCPRCKTPIVRLVQAGRSSFLCPSCQRAVVC